MQGLVLGAPPPSSVAIICEGLCLWGLAGAHTVGTKGLGGTGPTLTRPPLSAVLNADLQYKQLKDQLSRLVSQKIAVCCSHPCLVVRICVGATGVLAALKWWGLGCLGFSGIPLEVLGAILHI